jgi:hypothetical protein
VTPPPAPAGAARGRWNYNSLLRLVDDRAAEFPAEADSWNAYLFSLRDWADASGALPATLDDLILDVFAPLLERDASVVIRP